MKIRRIAAAAFLVAALLAAQTRTRWGVGLDQIKSSYLKADLTFLASDALEGRLSLTRGNEAAILWIASEFGKAGLKPLGENGTYLQRVPLIEYRVDRSETRLVVERGGQSVPFLPPDATANFPADIDLSAPVVFAGFGITAPELNYDDYSGIDAKGKIVVVFDHEPQETDADSIFNGKGNTRYAGTYVKTMIAQQHGAAALLVLPEPNRKHPSNQERLARMAGSSTRVARLASQALANSPIHIPVFTINDKVGAALFAGSPKTPKELQSAIDATLKPVSMALSDTKAHLHLVVSERRRGFSANVIGMVEGTDPDLKAETVIFSGHHDHDGLAPQGIYNGADDNGSGTVGVIALARAFARNPVKPKRSTVFIVFAAEERGLLGSYYYAEHPLRPLKTTRAVINFDMIGRDEKASDQTAGLIDIAADTSNEMNLVGTNYSPDYRKTVEKMNEFVGLKLNYKWDEEPALNVFFRSDQYPFVLKNIPAMWWFTGFHPDYHQVTDTVDRINFAKMEKILQLAYLTGFEFADAATPPVFKAAGR